MTEPQYMRLSLSDDEESVISSVSSRQRRELRKEKLRGHTKSQAYGLIAFLVTIAFLSMTILWGIRSTAGPPVSIFSKDRVVTSAANWRLDTNKEYSIKNQKWNYDASPQVREYHWTITDILAAPDGVVKNMTVINGQFPGPLVQCNAGDTIKVHIKNEGAEPTSIHFHGLFFKNQNYYDGATYINQCEIPPQHEYTMEFKVDEEQWGTYWYHSHYTTQAADGLVGPVVIHSKKEIEALKDMYDEEMVVLVGDHYHARGSEYMEEYLAPDNENAEPVPDNGLIQGANVFDMPDDYYLNATFLQEESLRHVFKFRPERKYRLRVINVGFFADLDFTIDNHNLTIIEADGTTVHPVTVDVLNIASAQRYSVIVNTNVFDVKRNMFWMHAKLNEYCFDHLNEWLRYDAKAVVLYVSEWDEVEGDYSAKLDTKSEEYQYVRDVFCRELDETLLHPLFHDPPPKDYDENVRLDAWFHIGDWKLDRGQFNDTTYRPWLPSSSLYHIAKNTSETEKHDGNATPMIQSHVPYDDNFLVSVNKPGAVIDVLINNLDDGSHPFHLHGYKFWVMMVGSGNFRFEKYSQIAEKFNATDDLEEGGYFMKRDTIMVPGYKWALVRFVADNPGVWPFHCHIGWHMEAGLLMQFDVLPEEYKKWDYPEQWTELCDIQEKKYTQVFHEVTDATTKGPN
ncbi:CYFA0S04e05842g1_1 [Cyberlindnera fabianii]|uniref:CYFA0S04e05842g1_1 n=1 Tax=Cyberlindnera fabianii TaxID=36022 RepID=A0A061ARK9_CYBFA|nr:CYFA0S04e05842g1_1 [Cyberlindnera fabianii]